MVVACLGFLKGGVRPCAQARLRDAEEAAREAAQLRFDKAVLEERGAAAAARVASTEAQLREARAGKSSAERLAASAERRQVTHAPKTPLITTCTWSSRWRSRGSRRG